MIDYWTLVAAVEGAALGYVTLRYLGARADVDFFRGLNQAASKDTTANLGKILSLEDENARLQLKFLALDAENQQWARQDVERRRIAKLNGDKGRAVQSANAAAKRDAAAEKTLADAAVANIPPREEVVAGVREKRARRKAA